MKKSGSFLLSILMGLCATAPLYATPSTAGFPGIKAATMAGASVAGASALGAAYYNVAASGQESQYIAAEIDISGLYNYASFLRRNDGQSSYSNNLAPKIAAAIETGFGHESGPALALSYYPSYEARQEWQPVEAAGEAVISDKGSRVDTLQLALAIRLGKVAIGAAIKNHFVSYNHSLLMRQNSAQGEALQKAAISAHDYLNISAAMGFIVTLPAGFKLAFSLNIPYSAAASGTITINDKRYDITVAELFPLIARGAVRYEKSEHYALELSFTYEHLAALKSIDFALKGPSGAQNMAIPLNYNERFSLHLGASYYLLPALELRGGLMYQNSAVPAEYLTPYSYDAHKLALGLGATYNFHKSFGLTIGYIYTYYVPRDEVKSRVLPLYIGNPPASAQTIGMGSYSYGIHQFGLSALYRF